MINLFTFIAEEVRDILAELGVRSLKDVIGRTDLLQQVSRGADLLDDLDLNPLLAQADPGPYAALLHAGGPQRSAGHAGRADDRGRRAPCSSTARRCSCTYTIRNTHRAIGTQASRRRSRAGSA